MGVFVFLPLVLPLTAVPIARLAEQHLHPRGAARLLTSIGAVMALCSAVCLGLTGVVGTAQIPGNPLPDSWSDPEVRAALPYHETVGTAAICLLAAVAAACLRTAVRHLRVRARARRALGRRAVAGGGGVSGAGGVAGAGAAAAGAADADDVAVLPDASPYAYALPGSPGWVVVSTGMLAGLAADEREALLAHERAHLEHRHHRYLLATQLAGCVNPFLRPLQQAVAYSAERWADEESAQAVGDRRVTARAVARAALVSHRAPVPGFAAFAAPGPVPRRVAALLGPVPAARNWPPAHSRAGVAAMVAAIGTAASALCAVNAAVALLLVLKAVTPL
ncbi:M56 family metallopeptidase [Kitasatospora sp. A2-31]|uniref:M56 family metallopeptidase n=1 Tax=Kitasatospora sp. A2-31 TaxID=2916414 RepID=UPI001EEC263E|nr:M56 family metallopeptidase [Kitasatospora sp. A2-31]MCG6497345.1 M56 family metallopeptidase [Kitasatospora sp. A2-31]